MDVQTPYERKEDEKNDLVSDNSNIEIPDISTPSLRYKWGNYKVICFSHLRKNSILEEKSIFITI